MKLPWISVEDRLPANPDIATHQYDRVLIWVTDKWCEGWHEGSYSPGQGIWKVRGSNSAVTVTHWLEVVPPEGTGDA